MSHAAGAHPWLDGPLTEQPALMIVGGYRCGTTSLFDYMAAHPQISPCLVKEPAFFFSLRFNDAPPPYPRGAEARAYLSLFRKQGPGHTLLEATSNYLNDPGCAARIAAAMPNARCVISLRDPIARLSSWYRFLRYQRWLAASVSFEQWIERQLADTTDPETRPYPDRALAHCQYAPAVEAYLEAFGSERVHLVWFDHLQQTPSTVVAELCRFAGLAPHAIPPRRLRARNESAEIVRPRQYALYRQAHRRLFKLLDPFPMLQFQARARYYGAIEPRLIGYFDGPAPKLVCPPALRQRLRAHYAADGAALSRLTGRVPPWSTH